ncbi:MAG: CDP-diacylglycerol--glycerol-3-phosphate 3-phosphatidyltransferase [Xanthomonadales bacterium]|nr:CDP-diacylglycerol--glycerol-3-phosphate 3-phosphatidyltransferase [Xanthomonadales bacterium]
MVLNTATILTLFRIALIPVLVVVFYLPYWWANWAATLVFILAGVTDWADGYIARKYNQYSRFGEFLDPVADKLMVAVTLVLVIQYRPTAWLVIPAAIIIGREITISALREWMAQIGERASVKVALLGKLKTGFQMTSLGFLLFREDIGPFPIFDIGHVGLIAAAVLTMWSMIQYLRAAWPIMKNSSQASDKSID